MRLVRVGARISLAIIFQSRYVTGIITNYNGRSDETENIIVHQWECFFLLIGHHTSMISTIMFLMNWLQLHYLSNLNYMYSLIKDDHCRIWGNHQSNLTIPTLNRHSKIMISERPVTLGCMAAKANQIRCFTKWIRIRQIILRKLNWNHI